MDIELIKAKLDKEAKENGFFLQMKQRMLV